MIYLVFICVGGILGLRIRYYCRHFAEQVSLDIYTCYCEIFPDNPPPYESKKSTMYSIKCGSNSGFFIGFSMCFLACSLLFDHLWLAAIIALKCSILATISLIDYYYKLIPTLLCQQLMVLGITATYFNLVPQNLAESLQSGAIGFVIFWLLYHFAKFYSQTEAFGRGDYWLIGGLATFQPWQALPQFIFIACITALLYAWWQKKHNPQIKFIPFAPFLCFGGLLVFGLNWATIS
ncbi:MAG: A24 family peptidase [Lonepinella koalarum]|nr:A24 family peptidase [Lonepinella koalarum]